MIDSFAEGVIAKDRFTPRMKWTTKREIIRALVQRIEIGQKKVAGVLRPPAGTSGRVLNPIMVTLSRA